MKTFILGVIAVLLVVAVLDMAQGKPGHSKHALEKHAHSKLEHSKPAPGKAGHQRDSDDDYKQCMKDTHGGPACVFGCLYESEKFTTNGEFNKDAYVNFLIDVDDTDQDYAMQLADECEASLAESDVPAGDICKIGEVMHSYCL